MIFLLFQLHKSKVEIKHQPEQAKNLMLLFAGLNIKQMPNQ